MFTYWSHSDGKEMYKKACYTRKFVVLHCQSIPFSSFSLSSPSVTKRHHENEQTILPVSCPVHFAQVTVCREVSREEKNCTWSNSQVRKKTKINRQIIGQDGYTATCHHPIEYVWPKLERRSRKEAKRGECSSYFRPFKGLLDHLTRYYSQAKSQNFTENFVFGFSSLTIWVQIDGFK